MRWCAATWKQFCFLSLLDCSNCSFAALLFFFLYLLFVFCIMNHSYSLHLIFFFCLFFCLCLLSRQCPIIVAWDCQSCRYNELSYLYPHAYLCCIWFLLDASTLIFAEYFLNGPLLNLHMPLMIPGLNLYTCLFCLSEDFGLEMEQPLSE